MATIDINSISNAQLKQLATEIDNSKISAHDNMIDDTEFGVFKQRAKAELLGNKLITNDDYKAIFGYENDTRDQIDELQTKIDELRISLYNGNYNCNIERGEFSEKQINFGKRFTFTQDEWSDGNILEKAICISKFCILNLVGFVMSTYNAIGQIICMPKDVLYLKNCVRQNPELYNELQEAEKQLAELQKQLEQL